MSSSDPLTGLIELVGWLLVGYSVVINTGFLALTVLAVADWGLHLRRRWFAGYDETFAEPLAPGISLLVPAYNESAGIVEAVAAMTALRYPDFEVVVVDDGSTDDTVARLIEAFDLVEVPLVVSPEVRTIGAVTRTFLSRRGSHNVVLVCKENGGKADALNVGVNVARKELVCMVDADSILDPDALLHVSRPFADDPGRVLAAGGVVRVANGSTVAAGRVVEPRMPRRWLPRVQAVEYVRAFLVGRSGWSRLGGLLIISGAFGLFRRDVLARLGGLDTTCIGEDAELVVRLHRWMADHRPDGRVVFVAEPVAWTEAPQSLRVLRSQRRRWHRGLAEILARHRAMVLRPRHGVVGMLALPWFVVFELLAPFVELVGVAYLLLGVVTLGLDALGVAVPPLFDPSTVLLLLVASLLYATVLSFVALLVDQVSFSRYPGVRNVLVAIRGAIEENFGYRQLNAWWRAEGALQAWRSRPPEWGNMERRGLGGE